MHAAMRSVQPMKFLLCVLAFVVAAVIACSANNTVRMAIGKQIYEFPVNRLAQEPHQKFPSSDSYGPIVLVWTTAELRTILPKYIYEAEGAEYRFAVMVFPESDGNLEITLDSYFLRGDFSKGRVEFDNGLKGYKVTRDTDSNRWDLLRIKPQSNLTPPKSIDEFWIADCSRPVMVRHVICQIGMQYRGNYVTVNVPEPNLSMRSDILKVIREQLDNAYRGPITNRER